MVKKGFQDYFVYGMADWNHFLVFGQRKQETLSREARQTYGAEDGEKFWRDKEKLMRDKRAIKKR